MNLIQQAEQLKSLPDQALAQMQQRPTEIPPYLIVAEMQRRASMRKAFQGQGAPMNQPPVAQQLAAPQQQPQPQHVPGMAGGGLASLAGYFDQMQAPMAVPNVDPSMMGMGDAPGYSTMNDSRFSAMRGMKSDVPAVRKHSEYAEDMSKLFGESPLKALDERYAKEEEEMRGKKPSISQILMNLGLGMAASRRPDWAGAIGEGGMNAMQGFVRDKERSQVMADRIAEKRLRAIEGRQRHEDKIQDYAIDARRGDIAAANTAKAGNNNIELAIMHQNAAESHDLSQAERAEHAAQARFLLEEAKDQREANRRREEMVFKAQADIAAAKIKASGRGKGEAKQEKLDPSSIRLIGVYTDMAADYDKQIEQLNKALLTTPDSQQATIQKRIDSIANEATKLRKRAMQMANMVAGIKEEEAPAPLTKEKTITPEELLNRFKPAGKPSSQASTQPAGPGFMESLGTWLTQKRERPHADVTWNK